MLTTNLCLRALTLATFIAAVSMSVPIESVSAQERASGERSVRVFKKPHRGPAIGGTSWTLSDVWGAPEMPIESSESPGFNYTPGGYQLNGPPNQAPYPN